MEVHVLLWISFDHGYDLESEHFLRIFGWYPYLEASEWMRCHVERGYGNLTPCVSTLWVRVKRHAIHHWLYSYAQRICGRLLQEVMEEVENTLLIAEGILYVTILCHNILLVFGLIISDIRMMSSISVDQ